MGEGVSALREFELKFEVSKNQLDRLLDKCALTDLSIGDPIENTLRSIYYDTDDRLLKVNGISLRIRQVDDRWVQTLKFGRGIVAGLSQPIEIERPIACGQLELDALGGNGIAADFKELLGDTDLQPLFETVITRTTRQLRGGGGS
ncbi:MAG: inorganic triphosphatase, partial [Aestuariivirgaceae bacterium]